MAKVELKQPIVQEISENIKDAQSVVVVDYRGLTVAEDTQLRKALREAGVTYKVYKNTLVSRAVEGTQFESLRDVLEGPNAFAISTTDATAPARVLADFAKKAPALEVKAGVVEGNFYDEAGMKAISSIPSREVLLSKLLGSLQSPITNLARVLNQIAEKGGAADAAVEAAPAEEAPAADEAAEQEDAQEETGEEPAAEEQNEEPAEEEEPAAEAQNRETRVTESVNIRSEASTDSDRIALAYQGDAITQIESYDNGWSKVEYKGETGYVKTEFLE